MEGRSFLFGDTIDADLGDCKFLLSFEGCGTYPESSAGRFRDCVSVCVDFDREGRSGESSCDQMGAISTAVETPRSGGETRARLVESSMAYTYWVVSVQELRYAVLFAAVDNFRH